MMGIVAPETCWACNKICNKNLCCIWLAFYFHIYTIYVCVSTLSDVRTTTKSPNRTFFQNVSPSLGDAYLYLRLPLLSKRCTSIAAQTWPRRKKHIKINDFVIHKRAIRVLNPICILITRTKSNLLLWVLFLRQHLAYCRLAQWPTDSNQTPGEEKLFLWVTPEIWVIRT